ncbi:MULTISPECIES: cytochrome C oxidase subunit IV family protein [Paenibacillus]|uniref:Cytochrome C oxidase subunit IV n=2 Tax=Paenibacillus TaxID=44249 RepID=A0A198AHS3_9BACL|nr:MULTISPECIES: cytochrome C oxidase subunit IV family protein [Paenibacillus]MDR6552097.1 cytochrome c oxidase subunit 4 [Paenibacillus qinlingensis]NQX64168.1 cytochrome C oxidase subunit IV family protein [Paenibacillus qinlingensis]OAS20615.1 cytochrome C oxidase subunit IV [Paenibacillus oryzisoli]
MSSNSHDTHAPSKRVKHDSTLNHYLTYIISILLTMLAFAVVLYGDLDRSFILIFIVSLGIVQALVQLLFWMHAKERGHLFPLIFIFAGAFVALTGVITAVYWVWW